MSLLLRLSQFDLIIVDIGRPERVGQLPGNSHIIQESFLRNISD
jgi:hypothetical protein